MELKTSRLDLTPLDPEEHADALHAAYGDPAVMSWWTRPATSTEAETRQLLAADAAQPGAALWAIRRAGDPAAIGMAGLLGGTAVPGLSWILAESEWGHGFATEAASAIVEHAFGAAGHDRVEAWVESTNTRSIAVCRKIGLTERGRLAQRYEHRDRPHEMIVLGRARHPEPTSVLHLEPVLPVTDVAATTELLRAALAGRVSFSAGEPPEVAGMVFGPWSAGPSVQFVRKPRGECAPVVLTLDVVAGFDELYAAVTAAGTAGVEPPVREPWGRREFAFRLPEGHRIVVSTPG
ncbi:GNAT family N-acetyltransferase [Amycolatopsis rubida]|uniref:Protein N-acetyltransferase, RimJ/RimL family n=1 Tax=Amycolatopsis rubida TaxID=112413 RepID=A0A1I6AJV1_9PSEU|nr:GNAT family N-acetyltransferase [Amycolatopsis rubida]SFQ68777.1 Protein N-acetyltransferase, RimJ/RimL family [Amycolatopsis rubida]